ISMAILLLKWKDLMVTFFDEHHARSIGLNTRGLKLLFFTLLAIAVAIGSLTSFFGAWLSYYLDGATGGIIVVAQTLLFLIT
ncbi:metal ABC transporter permease, partial [Klebsiella pneumoniae]|uniref:metal ABC transporter permease n=1 Tax=Klebsiella pneumoniae TaxID=573 RepID=UPI0030DC5CBB